MSRQAQTSTVVHPAPAPCMRPKDAAAFLGCGLSTLWLWAKQGKIPQPKKIGPRYTFWRRADLENFINEGA